MTSVDSPSATAIGIDPEAWADLTSRDLLAIQAQNRRLSPEERAELVEQQLRERIADLANEQRRGCLRALAARFPLASAGAEGEPTPAGAAAPLSAAEWVGAFDDIKEGLTPELQAALLEKLKNAGWLPAAAAPGVKGMPVPSTVEPLLPKDAVDPVRVAQLIDVVMEAMRALDGNFRRVWEGVADFGKTDHGLPRHSFEEVMRKFLLGDQDVPRVVLKNRVETTTKLIPAVLIAVKESWDTMEIDVGNCLPEEVQKRVKKATFGYEAGCWKEYTKAAEKLHPDSRVQEFFEKIVTKARAHIPR
jgi:hypothetical protein